MLSINDTHSQTHTTAIWSCWILNWLTVCPPNELTNWSLWSAGPKGGNWWERSPSPSLSSSSSFLAVLSVCHRSCLCGESGDEKTNTHKHWLGLSGRQAVVQKMSPLAISKSSCRHLRKYTAKYWTTALSDWHWSTRTEPRTSCKSLRAFSVTDCGDRVVSHWSNFRIDNTEKMPCHCHFQPFTVDWPLMLLWL